MSSRVVVTDHAFSNTDYERAVAEAAGAEFAEHSCATVEETVAAVEGADVALVNLAPMTAEVLGTMRTGSTIVRYGVGVDNVDLDAAREAGVRVTNVPDYGVQTVADHASAALLALSRRLAPFDAEIRAKGWVTATGLGPIRGWRQHTLGVLGFGRIGQAVANRLRPFGPTIIAYDPFCPDEVFAASGVERVGLHELAERATAISVHAPLTNETRQVVDDAFFNRLQDGAILVNTSRGGLLDESALASALRAGRLAGALLDVMQQEPIPLDSPLRDLPNLTLTPHAAYYDEESLDNLQRLASEEAARALRGEDLRCQVA